MQQRPGCQRSIMPSACPPSSSCGELLDTFSDRAQVIGYTNVLGCMLIYCWLLFLSAGPSWS